MKFRLVTLLAVLLVAPVLVNAADNFEPPPPDEVFRYEAEAIDGQLLIHWDVGDGFYLYKSKFSFSSDTDEVTLRDPVYPPGEVHTDEYFGEQEIFRHRFTIGIPYSGNAERVDLKMALQGCADFGFCYVPVTWNTLIDLPATTTSPAVQNKLQNLLNRNAGVGDQEFLPEDQAFQLETWMEDSYTVVARWLIADGYYLYRDKFAARSNSKTQPGPLELPDGVMKNDINFGEMEVYYDQIEVRIPLSRASPDLGSFELLLAYQGCAEGAICYPPGERVVTIELPMATGDIPDRPVRQSETDRLSTAITDWHIAAVIALFFGSGLLLAFTPCVLPMFPILLGIITGQGKDVTPGRAFSLSLTYVLGMALTYTIAGAAFAAAGQQAQAVFQKPWIISVLAALFVAMALSMFGFFTIQMPSAIQSWASGVTQRQKTGTFVGTAIIGVVSALVVTACVAPALVSALFVIGQSGDVVRGGLALFALSLGMGAPLLVVGSSAGKLLPKAGPWMDTIKALLGVMMLGVAIWMLERIVPGPVALALWGFAALIASVYLGAFRSGGDAGSPWQNLGRALGLAALVYGVVAISGALAGGSDALRPWNSLGSGVGNESETHAVEFERIKSIEDLDASLARAAAGNRPALLDFYADWCYSCIQMEEDTFPAPEVQAALGNALLLQADVTDNDEIDQALLQHFGIYGPPTIVFFDRNGRELRGFRVVGFKSADVFSAHVTEAFGNP